MKETISNKQARQLRLIATQISYADEVQSCVDSNHDAKIIFSLEVLEQHNPELFSTAYEIALRMHKNKETVDNLISKHIASDWSLHRMNLVVLALLRVAVIEIMTSSSLPISKIIGYYLAVAEMMLEKSEVHFINAILNKIAKECACLALDWQ